MISAFGVEHVISKGDPKMDPRAWESRTAAAARPASKKPPGAGLQAAADKALGTAKPKKPGFLARLVRR